MEIFSRPSCFGMAEQKVRVDKQEPVEHSLCSLCPLELIQVHLAAFLP